MSKNDDKDPTEGNKPEKDTEKGEKATKELGIVRHIHELLTKDDEGNKPEKDPAGNKDDKGSEKPEKPAEDDKDDKGNKDDKGGEGTKPADVQGEIDKTAEAIAQAEKDKKE